MAVVAYLLHELLSALLRIFFSSVGDLVTDVSFIVAVKLQFSTVLLE